MPDHNFLGNLTEHWPIWLVTITLVVAAVIDGVQLKVPNWLTFPMIVSGWVFGAVTGGLGRLRRKSAGHRRGLGAFAASLCDRRHGSWRREIASRRWRLGWRDHDLLRVLRLGRGRRA